MEATKVNPDRAAVCLLPGTIALGKIDLRNSAIVVLGFAAVVLAVSPFRSYPVTDDWIYARSVLDLLRWDYKQPDWAQATSFGHVLWGALFSVFFGSSFTVLAISTLVMSALCLILFYLLLRHLSVSGTYSLLGTAVLGFNPLYVYLSYSFMTDVTFLAYLLGATLFYVRGLQGRGQYWFWLGGCTLSLAYLTRQTGIVVLPVLLLYMWATSRWRWNDVAAACVIPVLAAGLYEFWSRSQPVPLITYHVQTVLEGLAEAPVPYLLGRSMRIAWTLSALGLCLLPVMRMPRRPVLALPIFVLLTALVFRGLTIYGSIFPVSGNVLDRTGFVLAGYDAAPLWSEPVLIVLVILSILALSLHLAYALECTGDWFRTHGWKGSVTEAHATTLLYGSGLLFALAVLSATPNLYDRYWLPVLPALIVIGLLPGTRRGNDSRPLRPTWGMYGWLPLCLLALFSIACQQDYMVHATARWQAAERLAASGIGRDKIDAGFEWQGWYLFDEGVRKIRSGPIHKYIPFPPETVLDRAYVVSDLPRQGYTQIEALPYTSWLNLGQTRNVLVLKRN